MPSLTSVGNSGLEAIPGGLVERHQRALARSHTRAKGKVDAGVSRREVTGAT